MTHMSTAGSRIILELGRLKSFLGMFTRNRRGILGVAIITLFLAVALGASLLTPYDPMAIVAFPKNGYRYAKPSWYRFLFPSENISENIDPITDPSFMTAESVKALEFDSTLNNQGAVRAEFVPNAGYAEGSGCAVIKFERVASTDPYGEVKASLTKSFTYTYSFSPQEFQGYVALLLDNPQNMSISTRLVLERVGGSQIAWSNENFQEGEGGWKTPYPWVDSDSSVTAEYLSDMLGPEWRQHPAKMMFPQSGEYRFGIEVTLNDTYVGQSANASVYLDSLWLKILGNSHGILGTDQYGRDLFSQLVYGTRISLFIGLVTAFLTTALGLLVGITAGYVGGYADQILMRFTDMLLVIPEVPLFIVLVAVLSPGLWNLILVMTILGWTGFARISRSQTLSLKERPFVEAAKAVGGGRFHIIVRHIIPNVMSLVYVSLATAVPGAIINEAWLSFLGLYDPNIMTWGRMLHDVESTGGGIYMWWWVIPPGLCIAAISLSFILIGYALDDILNPKLRERR